MMEEAGELADASLEGLRTSSSQRAALEEAIGRALASPRSPRHHEIAATTGRMKATAGSWPRRSRTKTLFLVVATLITLGVIFLPPSVTDELEALRVPSSRIQQDCLPDRSGGIRMADLVAIEAPGMDRVESSISSRVSDPESRLILFGDLTRKGAARWEAVWRARPDDAVLYGRYAMAHLNEHHALPPDYVATGERIDPGNGWYRFLDALVDAEDWNSGKSHLPVIRSAVEMPVFNSRRSEFLARQASALPPARDTIGLTWNRRFLRRSSWELVSVLSMNLRQRGMEKIGMEFDGSPDETKTLSADALWKLAMAWTRDAFEPADQYDLSLEMWDLLHTLEPWVSPARKAVLSRSGPPVIVPETPGGSGQSGLERPIPVSVGTFQEIAEPAARGARAVLDRFMLRAGLAGMWTLLGACWIATIRWRKQMGQMPDRMCDVLRRSDWWIIFTGSCLVPSACYLLVVHGPVFGISRSPFKPDPLFNHRLTTLALVLNMALGSVTLVRWRLAERGRIFGLVSPQFRTDLFFLAIGLLCFGAGTGVRFPKTGHPEAPHLLLWLPAVFILFWLAAQWCALMTSPPERRLQRSAIARATMIPLAACGLLLASMVMITHLEDRYWTRQETSQTSRPKWAGNLTADEERAAPFGQQPPLEALKTR